MSGDLTFNGATQSHTDLVALLTPLKEAGIFIRRTRISKPPEAR